MIHFVKGHIALKTPTYVVVEASGIGYQIHVSLYTYTKIEKLEEVKLLTYLQVREDSHTLYGFADAEERDIFVKLIGVNGIGANTARGILSAISPGELKSAIVGENLAAFKQVKGVGPKTAKRIILDLKDKVIKDGGGTALTVATVDNTLKEEALKGLLALGYHKIAAQKALNKILKEQADIANVETLIRAALKEFN